MPAKGIVFNIQRYTIHDGPGIRTELFMKGCPLHCRWCGNPEGFSEELQPGIYPSKCLGAEKCGICSSVCPNSRNAVNAVNTAVCIKCMKCAETCPADAVKSWGREITVEEAMDIIRRDKAYYDKSGGGVTISGGEPLLQAEFVAEVFKECRKEGIHTCVESTLFAEYEDVKKMIEYADMIITDIKHMDSNMHRKYTGVGNERILDNMKKIASADKPLMLRIPVIPGVNDNMDNMRATADFITEELENKAEKLQLLSFMRLGEEKYASLGMKYPMEDIEFDREEFSIRVREFAEYFNRCGIKCVVGTKDKD